MLGGVEQSNEGRSWASLVRDCAFWSGGGGVSCGASGGVTFRGWMFRMMGWRRR